MATEHFTDAEMACKCCGVSKMDAAFMERLEKARVLAGMPFRINCGYRCPKHEKEVNGSGANHPFGRAADIDCKIGPQRIKLLQGLVKAGFVRIGIGKTFIHVDTSEAVGYPESCWLY